jgi:hypothetical protein
MSYFIDVKYLTMVSNRLPMFKKKKSDLWNCRCIICGDSSTNKRKARGYFYRNRNDLFYKCHNCLASQHFGTFLKNLDSTTYQQYVFERYANGEGGAKAHKNVEDAMHFPAPVFKKKSLLETVAQRLDTLPPDNEAVQYCVQRDIPIDKYRDLYYIPSVKDIAKIAPAYANLKTSEPRLVLPFYNEARELTGVTMRALRGESLRYIMIKIQDDAPLLFGMNTVDTEQPITVVEGPIDSLFLKNAIACAGTGFGKIETLNLPKDKMTIVFDNQSRNVEVCKIVERYIQLDYRVCIWPCGLQEKDINDMVLAGKNVQHLIQANSYRGLMARLKFAEWRNC